MSSAPCPERLLEKLVQAAMSQPDVIPALLETLQAHHPDLVQEAILLESKDPVVVRDAHGVARIQGSVVAVWEIVRSFRRVGGVPSLMDLFPGLSEREIREALAYAGREPDEIAEQIQAFEDFRAQMSRRTPMEGHAVVLMTGSNG